MTGTASQIEWAEQIRSCADAEFERVAAAFYTVSLRQKQKDREDTLAIIAILEEKRTETMANDCAGYFIRHWQERTDQIRQIVAADGRYKSIRANRQARQREHAERLTEKSI